MDTFAKPGEHTMSKDAIFTMKLEPELREAFMAATRAADRPASQVVRQLMREYIQQDFRITVGVEVAQVVGEQLIREFSCICKISVVGKHDSVRRVNVKRLCLITTI